MPWTVHLVDVGRVGSAVIMSSPGGASEGVANAQQVGGSEVPGLTRSSGRDYATPAGVSEVVRLPGS